MSNTAEPGRRMVANEHFLPPRLFSVVTWGCSASDWLAYTLNECPRVFAVHHSLNLWRKFAGAAALPGVRYIELVGMQGHAAQLAGDVHGIARNDIPAIMAEFGDIFRAVVLVRDPLPRLRSEMAFFNEYEWTKGWDVDYIEQAFPHVYKALPTGSYAEKLFVHGVSMLNAILEEVAVGPIFRMEDLTSRPETLIGLVDYLSDGTVKAPVEWAQAAVSSHNTNRHGGDRSVNLETWQRRVLADVLIPTSIEIYRKLGYDVDSLLALV